MSEIEEILERQKLGVLLGDLGLHIALLLFADDMVICAESRENLEKGLMLLQKFCQIMKLEINYQKTKEMTKNSNDNNKWPIMHDGKQHDIETVSIFKYLGLN